MTHGPFCIYTDGDYQCQPSCTHDRDEMLANRELILQLAQDQICEMRGLLEACGTHNINFDTCAVCKLHFAECEAEIVCSDYDETSKTMVDPRFLCPGARARAYLRAEDDVIKARAEAAPLVQAALDRARREKKAQPLSPELRLALGRAMKDFKAGRTIPGEFVTDMLRLRGLVEKLRDDRDLARALLHEAFAGGDACTVHAHNLVRVKHSVDSEVWAKEGAPIVERKAERQWHLTLNEYQRANLLWLLCDLVGYGRSGVEPFTYANTGDWAGEIPNMLRDDHRVDTEHKPNVSVEDIQRRVEAFRKVDR
jgi:hypothetical protein